jgi:flagellar hook-basal body complex protein FliE
MQSSSIQGSTSWDFVGEMTGPSANQAGAPAPFADLMKDAIATVQDLSDQATTAVEGLMRGDGTDVHTAMIATQKANLAFEMSLAVRNKAVAAYQQVMQLQF